MNALELADELDNKTPRGALTDSKAAAMLRNLHTESMALRCAEMALRDEIAELRRQLAARVPESVVASALFDFGGYLTTRKDSITFGSYEDASPMIKCLQAFAKKRGLSIHDAAVEDWQSMLASAPPALQAENNDATESVNETNAVLASRYFDLLKVIESYEKHGVTCQNFRHFVSVPCAECNAVLEQPEQTAVQGEPVAAMRGGKFQWLVSWFRPGDVDFYAHTQQASKPMTDEQARELCKEIHGPGYMPSDLKTVRATERFYNIKE